MAEHTLMTVMDQMGFFAPEIVEKFKGNIEDSIAFGKAAAKAAIQKGNPDTPVNLNTDEYYEAYQNNITKAAWNIRQQATQKVSSQGSSIKTNDMITNLLAGVGLPQAQLDAMKNMWNAIEASSSTGVKDFMSFFWQNSNQSYKNTQFMVSPWYLNENENVEMCVTYFGYEEKIDSWRSLFVAKHQESFVGTVKSLRAEFFTQTWENVGKEIHERVSSHEKDIAKKTSLSF